jgi:hypothetical protein
VRVVGGFQRLQFFFHPKFHHPAARPLTSDPRGQYDRTVRSFQRPLEGAVLLVRPSRRVATGAFLFGSALILAGCATPPRLAAKPDIATPSSSSPRR